MKLIHFIKKRLSIRSLGNAFKRIWTLFSMYGFTNEKFAYSLKHFIYLANQYGIKPTLPVTASVVNRHPRLFQKMQKEDVEWAIHGKYHIDYTQIKIDKVRQHLHYAIDIFERNNIPYSGYRFPFLRKDDERVKLLTTSGFSWDSSDVISWNSLNSNLFHHKNWDNYEKILHTYRAGDADQIHALPFFQNGLVEIPISIPDDDIIIERLGIQDEKMMYAIWEKILSRVRDRGELFIMQVHPERYNIYKNALRKILKNITDQENVWIASLQEIAEWWQERNNFSLKIKKLSNNRHQIIADCTDRATIIYGNGSSNILNKNRKHIFKKDVWEINSQRKPIIGVDPHTTPDMLDILKREGYPYEISIKKNDYNYFLKHIGKYDRTDELQILQSIQKSHFPLIRFWYWPNQLHYGFSLTGDIDGVNLWDYGERFHG